MYLTFPPVLSVIIGWLAVPSEVFQFLACSHHFGIDQTAYSCLYPSVEVKQEAKSYW